MNTRVLLGAADDQIQQNCGCLEGGLTLKVDDWLGLNLSCVTQAGSRQELAGSQVSELPVSKQPVNCLGGVPR